MEFLFADKSTETILASVPQNKIQLVPQREEQLTIFQLHNDHGRSTINHDNENERYTAITSNRDVGISHRSAGALEAGNYGNGLR